MVIDIRFNESLARRICDLEGSMCAHELVVGAAPVRAPLLSHYEGVCFRGWRVRLNGGARVLLTTLMSKLPRSRLVSAMQAGSSASRAYSRAARRASFFYQILKSAIE